MASAVEPGAGFYFYAHDLAHQPPDAWEGFYPARAEAMNYGYRFQLAFLAYAIAALGWRSPACRSPYATLLERLIEKMLQRRVWAYWQRHRDPPEPLERANIMYSGHLAQMIGLYEQMGGDDRYDAGFTLTWNETVAWPYTHTRLVERLYAQMAEVPWRAVTCEPGNVYAACNNHAALANLLHDQLHGTTFAHLNAEWVAWFLQRMVLRRATRVRGLIAAVYRTDLDLALPISLNFLDAWGLAFLRPYAPEVAEQLYARLVRRLRRRNGLAWLPASPGLDRLEVCNTALNSGFAYILARELGDTATATALRAYAEARLRPTERNGARWYATPPAPYITALFALGDVLVPGDLARWGRGALEQPAPADPAVSVADPAVAFVRARWDAGNQTLQIEAIARPGQRTTLHIHGLPPAATVWLNGERVPFPATAAGPLTQVIGSAA
jgi:hypothetical protein